MALQHLARRRRHRHGHVPFAAEREAEVEVLAQKFGRERGGPVEIDQRRRLVAREHGAHHAVVHEGEERVAGNAHLVGQQRDFNQVLDHHAEHDVVGDLADARELAAADVGDAARGDHFHERGDGLARGLAAGDHRGELARLDDLGIAAHRRRHVFAAELLQPVADRGRLLDRDGRAVDEDFRQLAAMAGDAVLAEIDLVQILAGRDDGEQHVHVLELDEIVDHLAADLGQRLGLGAGAVPDGEVITGLEQALGHGITHAAHADPTDLLLVRCHSNSPCSSPGLIWRCPSIRRKRLSSGPNIVFSLGLMLRSIAARRVDVASTGTAFAAMRLEASGHPSPSHPSRRARLARALQDEDGSGGVPKTRSAARWNSTSAVRHQISTMMMRISWNPAIIVESSPSTLPVSTISAMPAGAMANTLVGTGYPASHAIAPANSATDPAANSTTRHEAHSRRNSRVRNSGLNWAPSALPMRTCAAIRNTSGMRPSIQPRWLAAAAMKSGAMSQALGERVRESKVAMTPDTRSRPTIGSQGTTGIASSGFWAPPPTKEITRNGANTTMSATLVVCATMMGSSWPP